MKDEEMAEEYTAENGFGSDCNNLTSYDANTEIEKAFLAGLKAGKKWHSPDEHIDKDKVVLGIIKHCNKTRYSLVQWNGEWWYQYGTFNAEVRLIAWYNLPELKESE